jgi:hypothetical protein
MARYAQATENFDMTPDRARTLLVGAFVSIGASVKFEDPERGLLVAKVSPSIFSWGEECQASILANGSACQITVNSRSSLSTTLVDWGKNNRNVRRVFEYIRGALESRPPEVPASERR